MPITAEELLEKSSKIMRERAASRGLSHERSIPIAVSNFNKITNNNITNSDALMFMLLLKLARAEAGSPIEDDFIDALAYLALYAEEILTEK
jgi:hypothetical protein